MSNEEKIKLLRRALSDARSEVSKRLSEIGHSIRTSEDRQYCEITLRRIDEALEKTRP
jgi:hypothetical protein